MIRHFSHIFLVDAETFIRYRFAFLFDLGDLEIPRER